MNFFEAFSIALHRRHLSALLLAFGTLVGCTEPASEQPWRIDGVRADSGRAPVGILAIGSEVVIGESGVEFKLGGASLAREAEVTQTDAGALIELEVQGQAVELEFVQLDEDAGELRWTIGGTNLVAEMSRGGDK